MKALIRLNSTTAAQAQKFNVIQFRSILRFPVPDTSNSVIVREIVLLVFKVRGAHLRSVAGKRRLKQCTNSRLGRASCYRAVEIHRETAK